ncbi:uncharacterized protein [Scyliorhinus torazame]|uniref:uncharacterized protein n=1 Tax=Scyliorhinus torazame TaxID=75743 RepID=UPI003B5B55D6
MEKTGRNKKEKRKFFHLPGKRLATGTQRTESESFDSFRPDLRMKVQSCNFSTLKSSMIRDQMVFGISNDKVHERLLREEELQLENTINICHACKPAAQQISALNLKQFGTNVGEEGSTISIMMQSKKKRGINVGGHFVLVMRQSTWATTMSSICKDMFQVWQTKSLCEAMFFTSNSGPNRISQSGCIEDLFFVDQISTEDTMSPNMQNEVVQLSDEIKANVKVEEDKADGEMEEPKGIPGFWLTAFKNVDLLSDMIQEHDEPILKHLQYLQLKFSDPDQPMSFTLEFMFEPNDYFTNEAATKTYQMESHPDESNFFFLINQKSRDAQGCEIDWKKGKNITLKTIKTKQKYKDRGIGRTVTKTVPNDSFLNFFSPPEVPEHGEQDEGSAARLAADFEIDHFLHEHIIPRAVSYFTGEAAADDDDDCDYDDDDDYFPLVSSCERV